MNFKLSTVCDLYKDKKESYVNFLKELGFEFEHVEFKAFSRPINSDTWIRQDIAKKESFVNIELNTLEELLELQTNSGHALIVRGSTIKIYDGYNE